MFRSVVVFAAVFSFGTAFAAVPNNGGPPRIDVQRVCALGASEIRKVFGDSSQDVLTTCIQDEEAARDELVKSWGDFPALAKSFCIQPDEYLPSYVEWVACMEMTRDVIKMRQERSAGTGSNTGAVDMTECPIVNIGDDGTINWVDNCRSRTHTSKRSRRAAMR